MDVVTFIEFQRIHKVLARIAALLEISLANEATMTQAVTDLQAAVAAEDTELGQVVAYLTGLPALVAAAVAAAQSGDTATVQAITADVTAQTAALAAALQSAPGQATGATGPTRATA